MRSLGQVGISPLLFVAARLAIGLSVAPGALAAAPGPDSTAEVTPPPPVVAGAPDPLFDEEFEEEFDVDLVDQSAGFPDPWEETNRGVLGFNDFVDRYLLDPITVAYGFVFPGPAKAALRRAFANADEPSTVVNDVIQLEWTDALKAGARFLVNSSIGIGGLFDPAASWGLERHQSDFDQTLALAGTPSGPYVVLPFVGPNTVRGGASYIVDAFTRPTFYLTYLMGPVPWAFVEGGAGISTREAHLEQVRALRGSSVDYYAALRSAYYQNRTAEIWSRRADRLPKTQERDVR